MTRRLPTASTEDEWFPHRNLAPHPAYRIEAAVRAEWIGRRILSDIEDLAKIVDQRPNGVLPHGLYEICRIVRRFVRAGRKRRPTAADLLAVLSAIDRLDDPETSNVRAPPSIREFLYTSKEISAAAGEGPDPNAAAKLLALMTHDAEADPYSSLIDHALHDRFDGNDTPVGMFADAMELTMSKSPGWLAQEFIDLNAANLLALQRRMPKAKSRANVAFAEEYKRHKRDRTTDATISECMGYKGPDGYDRFKKKKARCAKAGLI